LFSSTIVISAFIASTPFVGAARSSVRRDWVAEAPGTRGSLPEAPTGWAWFVVMVIVVADELKLDKSRVTTKELWQLKA